MSKIKEEKYDAKNWKEELIKVPTVTIDKDILEQYIKENINLSFIKIDVEGTEFDVLLGAEETLKRFKPIIIIEVDRESSATLKNDFFKYFSRLNYKLFQFTGGIFTKKNWSLGGAYWQIWLVHKNSKSIRFFNKKYLNFIRNFVSQKIK